MTFLKQSDTLS